MPGGLPASPLPGSRALAPPGIEQAKAEWHFNANRMPYVRTRAYNATGGALTVGGVYGLTVSGASATTQNPQLQTVAINGGRHQTLVVALEAAANNSWTWVCPWGYVEALVEGTTDVTIDDALVAVPGQTYLIKAGGSGVAQVAEALEGQTANSAVLTDIYLKGEEIPTQAGAIQYTEVSLTAAQILDLADTPVQLVAAPGAGRILEFLGCVLFLDHAGTGFAESADNLQVAYEQESGAKASQVIECTGFIDQTGDTMTIGEPKNDQIVAKAGCENKALVLCNINDDFTDAGTTTSVLRVKTAYRIHVTGW